MDGAGASRRRVRSTARYLSSTGAEHGYFELDPGAYALRDSWVDRNRAQARPGAIEPVTFPGSSESVSLTVFGWSQDLEPLTVFTIHPHGKRPLISSDGTHPYRAHKIDESLLDSTLIVPEVHVNEWQTNRGTLRGARRLLDPNDLHPLLRYPIHFVPRGQPDHTKHVGWKGQLPISRSDSSGLKRLVQDWYRNFKWHLENDVTLTKSHLFDDRESVEPSNGAYFHLRTLINPRRIVHGHGSDRLPARLHSYASQNLRRFYILAATLEAFAGKLPEPWRGEVAEGDPDHPNIEQQKDRDDPSGIMTFWTKAHSFFGSPSFFDHFLNADKHPPESLLMIDLPYGVPIKRMPTLKIVDAFVQGRELWEGLIGQEAIDLMTETLRRTAASRDVRVDQLKKSVEVERDMQALYANLPDDKALLFNKGRVSRDRSLTREARRAIECFVPRAFANRVASDQEALALTEDVVLHSMRHVSGAASLARHYGQHALASQLEALVDRACDWITEHGCGFQAVDSDLVDETTERLVIATALEEDDLLRLPEFAYVHESKWWAADVSGYTAAQDGRLSMDYYVPEDPYLERAIGQSPYF